MTSIQCASCKHYTGELKCAAYPKGIPEEIMLSRVDHRKAQPGDNDIQWEVWEER